MIKDRQRLVIYVEDEIKAGITNLIPYGMRSLVLNVVLKDVLSILIDEEALATLLMYKLTLARKEENRRDKPVKLN